MPFSASSPTRIVDAFQVIQFGKHSDLGNPCVQIVRVARTAMENRRYSTMRVDVCKNSCDDVPRGELHRSPAGGISASHAPFAPSQVCSSILQLPTTTTPADVLNRGHL